MFRLRRKRHSLIGLDISSTSVKLIELAPTGSGSAELYRVAAFAVEPLPANAVVEKKLADIEAVGQCIKRAVASSGTGGKHAAVAVSGSAVITKIIAMSASLSAAEMEMQIQMEADQYIPYPLEEVNIDFDVLGASSGSSDMVDVLLAASRRENVDDRVAALAVAGLTADIVDVEAYAMENACGLLLGHVGDDAEDQTIAIADVGATTTTLHVLRAGSTVYTREQNFGGNQLLDEVQRRYGLSRQQAQDRLLHGQLPDNVTTEVLGPFKEALAQQIGRALQFYYSASTSNRTDQVILAGGSASIPKLDELVGERLGLPVSIADPFADMAIGERIDKAQLMRAAPSMMIAVGLALRGLD